MAGPWFAVTTSGNEWQDMETTWVSNGTEHEPVRVQFRVELDKTDKADK